MSIEQIFARHDGVLAGADGLPNPLQVLSHSVNRTDNVYVLRAIIVTAELRSILSRCRCRPGRRLRTIVVGGVDVVELSFPPGQSTLLKVR